MALIAGSVTVSDSGAVVKTGAAGRLYDKLFARAVAQAIALGTTLPVGADGAPTLKGIAAYATDTAEWLVTEITTYAKAQVPTSAAGLQRTPSPNDPNVDTQGPSALKELAIL